MLGEEVSAGVHEGLLVDVGGAGVEELPGEVAEAGVGVDDLEGEPAEAGDLLELETPGGGGFGPADPAE